MNPQNPLTTPQNSSRKKRVLVVVISSIVGIAAIASITAFFLSVLNSEQPAPETQAPQAVLTDVDTPEKLIAEYTNSTIEIRDTAYTKRGLTNPKKANEPQENPSAPQGPTNSVITYKKNNSFAVQVSSSDYVQYERNDTAVSTNDTQLLNATEAFLKDKGLVKTDTLELEGGTTYITYDSSNVVCQTSSMSALGEYPATYGVACISKEAIDAQYTTINELLGLVDAIDVAKVESVVVSVPIVDGAMQLIDLTTTTSDKAYIYYFATQNTAPWKYVGQRPVTTPDDTSFVLPSDLANAIKDPKWNGFLERYIK